MMPTKTCDHFIPMARTAGAFVRENPVSKLRECVKAGSNAFLESSWTVFDDILPKILFSFRRCTAFIDLLLSRLSTSVCSRFAEMQKPIACQRRRWYHALSETRLGSSNTHLFLSVRSMRPRNLRRQRDNGSAGAAEL
jgi:hypothetical protein